MPGFAKHCYIFMQYFTCIICNILIRSNHKCYVLFITGKLLLKASLKKVTFTSISCILLQVNRTAFCKRHISVITFQYLTIGLSKKYCRVVVCHSIRHVINAVIYVTVA